MSEKVADSYLAEFESLRDEIFSRFESQRQAFNYLMALIAALAALIASDKFRLDQSYIVFLPLIAAPLGFIFFDNEIVIWSIGAYINNDLRPRLSEAVGRDVLLIESRRSTYISGSNSILHLLLSIGRWILFLLPVGFPIGYAIKNRLWTGWPFGVPFGLIICVDCMLAIVLMWAMVSTIIMRQAGWRST